MRGELNRGLVDLLSELASGRQHQGAHVVAWAVEQVVQLAELVGAANPRPRLGSEYKLPVIFAGNAAATDKIEETLAHRTDLQVVENLRPVLERENLGPAREKIHDLFMEHVMAQAPGYGKLRSWVQAPIMPTPAAVGNMIRAVAQESGKNVIGVDIGGATTDMFSDYQGTFNRTVSANLGMSYSIANVLAEAGYESILRWVPLDVDEEDLKDFLDDLNLDEPGLNRVIRAGYGLLGLQTYFTAGEKEVRAWTVSRGATAPEAAAVIHTDFQKGFIRAEVVAYDDFVQHGGENGAKDAGRWRLEGKDYLVQEGDVMHFRFNV